MKKLALVIFKEEFGKNDGTWLQTTPVSDVVIAPNKLREEIEKTGRKWESLEKYITPGSIYEASAFLEELSRLTLSDGSRLSKSFTYKGYELWWTHYNSIFLNQCLPYTQYKKLLEFLKDFKNIYLYEPPHSVLFLSFLKTYESKVYILREPKIRSPHFLPFGVVIQIMLTFVSLLVLFVLRHPVMVFIGDKFDGSKDYDFRYKFIYKELRSKGIPFVEFIRSLESWKIILKHFLKRKRPVIYSVGLIFIARFLGMITGGNAKAKREFGHHNFAFEMDLNKRFKYILASQYLLGVYDDMWAIRINKWILHAIGVKVALIPAALERNYHTVLACKLGSIPTVGILHGVASKSYNVYDFLPAYDGEKSLSVDKYGVWSEWWKEYYVENSKVYSKDQLFVSGPMRPLENKNAPHSTSYEFQKNDRSIKVLFVPGELSNPEEVMPYLLMLMNTEGVSVYLTFRPYRDRFKNWLTKNNPQIIEKVGKDKILLGNIHDAISKCDIVVGTYSTAALEGLLDLKPVVFFVTNKWGDYFSLKDYHPKYTFYAESQEELLDCIRRSNGIPKSVLEDLRKRFFGDPYQNGSKWMVEEAEKILHQTI